MPSIIETWISGRRFVTWIDRGGSKWLWTPFVIEIILVFSKIVALRFYQYVCIWLGGRFVVGPLCEAKLQIGF
jgi:hypothetical protein